jgi:hypothetical protein
MNILEMKDAFVTDLENGGDLSTVIWEQIRSRKSMKTDWISLENAMRVVFQLHEGNQLSERATLVAISELLGAITGRGNGLAV